MKDSIVVRWAEMVEICARAGLSLRTVKLLVKQKKIPKRVPRVKLRGVKTPRAYYLREDVEKAVELVLGAK